MREPVTDDGENLVGVGEFTGDEQTAVFEFLFDDLLGNQLAAFEIGGDPWANGEDDFDLFFVEPDTVFPVEQYLERFVRGVGGFQNFQSADFAEGIGFGLTVITGGEIPDAIVVNQTVGGDFNGFACIVLLVSKAHQAAFTDGVAQVLEFLFAVLDVLVGRAVNVEGFGQALIEEFTEELGIQSGEQSIQPRQRREVFHVAEAEFSEIGGFQGKETIISFQRQEGKAFQQVALDGTRVNTEFLGQPVGVQLFAVVELEQNIG